MDMTHMSNYMQPEMWTQFWQNQNQNNTENQSNEMLKIMQNFTQTHSQYMQRMLSEWQQLTLNVTKPESLPQECNKFMKRAAENSMEHAQNMMQVMQRVSTEAMKACTPKTPTSNKKV